VLENSILFLNFHENHGFSAPNFVFGRKFSNELKFMRAVATTPLFYVISFEVRRPVY